MSKSAFGGGSVQKAGRRPSASLHRCIHGIAGSCIECRLVLERRRSILPKQDPQCHYCGIPVDIHAEATVVRVPGGSAYAHMNCAQVRFAF